MEREIKKLVKEAKEKLESIGSRQELIEFRGQLLGRKSKLQALVKRLPQLPLAERRTKGVFLNQALKTLEGLFQAKEGELLGSKRGQVDESLPGVGPKLGAYHPLSRITDELINIFSRIGFEVAEGPEAETETNNFDLLNIPADHPSRDEWDTFWLKMAGSSTSSQSGSGLRGVFDGKRVAGSKDSDYQPPAGSHLLLRTHTSPVQIRYMKAHKPPIRIIVPGRTFRYEAEDATHSSEFYQLEGLVVDKGMSVADLKGVIEYFLKEMFGTSSFRLRPSFFPFTEPSFEVDMLAPRRSPMTTEVGLPRGKGFLELLGAGMVHPQVLRNCGIDPRKYSGFAFGAGIDRIAMIKYGISDIRLFLSGDMRFIKQFR